ncbi:hypothetical protein HMI54_013456 [Coelomomyces lativittatus]|nr:hypothetical protein HMI54_013456 [Coelomomyces lativittatus]
MAIRFPFLKELSLITILVCLSILGTWTGESADEWRSTYSIHYILRAIQSLIMTQKPYHNEPGYSEIKPDYGKPEEVELYGSKIEHEVMRVAVCNMLEECLNSSPKKEFRNLQGYYQTPLPAVVL